MSENPLDQQNLPEENPQPEIIVNEYGETRDPAVVVDEPDRTVLLTQDETIVIDKEPRIDIVPTNRPRKVYGGMWGPAELVTVGFAMVAILIVALIYIFMLAPAKRELEHNRAERDRLEADLITARNRYGNISDTETQVEKLMASVDEFEANHLSVASNGRTSLYQRINSLIAGYGLVNTSGPDYQPLETLDQNASTDGQEESGRAKYKSLFPGVYVTTTVEGSYQSIRRFIRDVETGGDFIVVSAIELEPSDSEQRSRQPNNVGSQAGPMVNTTEGFSQAMPNMGPNAGTQQAPPSRNKGKMHGDVVSLRLEMVAYFRRPNVMPSAPATVQQ